MWISVKDSRPEKGQHVICSGKHGGMFAGAFRGGYEVDEEECVSGFAWDLFGAPVPPRKFVYWMPLPEPPKEEDADHSKCFKDRFGDTRCEECKSKETTT